METSKPWWGPAAVKQEGPGALDDINVRRLIKQLQADIERVFDKLGEVEKPPYSKRTLAYLKAEVERARAEYLKLPKAVVTGGIIDRFTITRVQNDRRWVIRATMMYNDGTMASDAEFRSRRAAGAWARSVIRLGITDLDVEFTPERPAERVVITVPVVVDTTIPVSMEPIHDRAE